MFVLVPETTQVIVELVAPGTTEDAVTFRFVSGESVNVTPVGVPTEQLAAPVVVTVCELESME
jgi:hypothetical protein